MEATAPDTIPVPKGLSKAQARVYPLVVQGLSAKEIGAKLHIAPKTAENQRDAIRRALGLPTVPKVIVWHYTSFVPSLAKGAA